MMTSPRGGPPLPVPALAFAGLTVAGAFLGGSGPRPSSTAAEVLAYASTHGTLMSLGAALLLGSAFPLVVYAATALHRIGGGAPGPLMGFGGAVLAAGGLVLSALAAWAAAQTAGLADAELARLLATLWFGAGSVGFTAPLGLLLLGLGVPVLVRRQAPAWLGWAAVVVGAIGLVTTFALVTDLLYPLIPVARFGGVLVLVGLAVTLRAEVREAVR